MRRPGRAFWRRRTSELALEGSKGLAASATGVLGEHPSGGCRSSRTWPVVSDAVGTVETQVSFQDRFPSPVRRKLWTQAGALDVLGTRWVQPGPPGPPGFPPAVALRQAAAPAVSGSSCHWQMRKATSRAQRGPWDAASRPHVSFLRLTPPGSTEAPSRRAHAKPRSPELLLAGGTMSQGTGVTWGWCGEGGQAEVSFVPQEAER